MDRELFRKIIVENQELVQDIALIERPLALEENCNYVFVGVRQAGKSYLLYQRIQQLLKTGHSINEIVYVNFDDERIAYMKTDELDLILQAHASLYDTEPIFFFDEIQNVTGWENFARRLANRKYRVYITGSNAKMLSRDMATTLGGRYFCQNVYPYSFNEYLNANGMQLANNWEYGKMASKVSKHFDTYFYYGGFPELLNITAKRAWLNGIYSKIFFSDIMVRNKVRSEEALRITVKRLAESVKQPTAFNRIANLVKSAGISTSTSSIVEFVRYLNDACLTFSLPNYASKSSEKETIKKHYFVDNGLLNVFLIDAETSLLENLCAIHLYKQYEEQLYYYNKNIEVDFFIPEIKTAVQVCYSLQDESTVKRELLALEKLDKFLPLDRLFLITRDESRTYYIDNGKKVEAIPVWQWILNDL